jgi:hypothetical protein
LEAVAARTIEEQAFGSGHVFIWDEGIVELQALAPTNLILTFLGSKVTGTYQLRKTNWYPGNRWMLTKTKTAPSNSQPEQPENILK